MMHIIILPLFLTTVHFWLKLVLLKLIELCQNKIFQRKQVGFFKKAPKGKVCYFLLFNV